MNAPNQTKQFPTIQEFYINANIYQTFPITSNDKEAVFNLIHTCTKIECYCLHCKKNSFFEGLPNFPSKMIRSGVLNMPTPITVMSYLQWDINVERASLFFQKDFRCVLKPHDIRFYISLYRSHILKVGQMPPYFIIKRAGRKEYSGMLNSFNKDYENAHYLFDHGLAVGAFAYLRRIIEQFVINPSYEKAKLAKDWDDKLYNRMRIRERINILKDFLPDFLVQNPALYSVISKGIHELTEEECKKYFPVVSNSIEAVLDEMKAQMKKQEVAKALNKHASELGRNK